MLFNSFEFIFLFFPLTFVGFILVSQSRWARGYQLPLVWLVFASLIFYRWVNPANLGILIFSILFNYIVGQRLGSKRFEQSSKRLLLTFGIVINLAGLAYFKYANFIAENASLLLKTDFNIGKIILPLGISFFTFQQIAYLVDAYQGKTKEDNPIKYSLFASFFPNLLAGPIVRHKEVAPQYENPEIYRFSSQQLAVGLTVFFMGMFKKVIFADGVSAYVSPVFNEALTGEVISFSDAWGGAIAYTLQLYFDFSGYSDMAIGVASFFGIRLPLNFNSPYKSISITDFWRRWHITLSNFLRDYLYIPMGGSRRGEFRRCLNLLLTMLLGGLWHGVGWTFVLWGGLHGAYLVTNHQWRRFRHHLGHDPKQDRWVLRGSGWGLTFFAVVVSWVFFRAESIQAAFLVLQGMAGLTLGADPSNILELEQPDLMWLASLLLIIWVAPNVQEWMGTYSPALHVESKLADKWSDRLLQKLQWRPSPAWALIAAVITVFAFLGLARVSEFLYFEF